MSIDPFIIFLMVIISLIAIVLVLVGIQLFLILRQVNRTLSQVNRTLSGVETAAHNLVHPASDLKAVGQGVQTGLHIADHILNWAKHRHKSN